MASGYRLAVALLAEGVDRNLPCLKIKKYKYVALLAEGVDRNILTGEFEQRWEVALLAEGVDRNWRQSTRLQTPTSVALLAEGVDRNVTPEIGTSMT